MQDDFGYSEEDQLGKPYDLKLLKRLYPFFHPYARLLVMSVFLVVAITLLDLAVPYLTKIAIDRYIVPLSRLADKSASGEVSKAQFFTVDLADPGIVEIVANHPELFVVENTTARINYQDLSLLSAPEIKTLRSRNLQGLVDISAIFLAVVFLSFGFNFSQMLVMEYTGQQIMHDLRMTVYDHIQSLSVSFFNRNPTGRLVTRVTNDVGNMYDLFTSVITFVFKDLFLLVGIALVLVSVNWQLAIVSFSVLPFVMLGSLYFARQARDAFRILRIKLAEINTRFSETVTGIKIIQLFRHEAENFRKFETLNHENFLAGMTQIRILGLFMPFIEFMGVLAIAMVIYYGGAGVLKGNISLGSLVAFISYMKMFFRPIRDISEKYNVLQNAMASAERLFLILDNDGKDAKVLGGPKSDKPLHLKSISHLCFDRVSFHYRPGEPILNNISFSLSKNEIVAIVGPTGSGKTTLIHLILRFYDAQSGIIYVNGTDSRHWNVESLRSRMALVSQDPFLFSQSLMNNIFSEPQQVPSERVQQIINAANCGQVIEKLPEGLQTVLAEGGANLSSGERQLVSIARALAIDPDLIILDEATSYIDSDTEARIQRGLLNLLKNRSAILVAHRLSTARYANKIIVLNKGKIIEMGSHDELMARKGFYYRLTLVQSADNADRNSYREKADPIDRQFKKVIK